MSSSTYDLAVIGSGPAGQKGAIAAAKAHKRVALATAMALTREARSLNRKCRHWLPIGVYVSQ